MSKPSQQNNHFETWDFPIFEQTLNTENLDSEVILHNPEPIIEDNSAVKDFILEEDLLPKKLQYLDNIALQIQQTLTALDTDLFPQLIVLIKKTVKKIILKELALDESRFPEMITVATDSMARDNQPCIIYVSANDHELFENHVSLTALDIRIDPALKPGDFIIKNPFSELQAILEQRLNQLFGC